MLYMSSCCRQNSKIAKDVGIPIRIDLAKYFGLNNAFHCAKTSAILLFILCNASNIDERVTRFKGNFSVDLRWEIRSAKA